MIPRNLKIAAVIFLLFAAIVVDFVSGFMSMMFDAMFIGGAGFILFGLIRKGEDTTPE